MSQVAAVSGATGKEFDDFRAKAREMGAKTKFSASEAEEAMNYMVMAGWKSENMDACADDTNAYAEDANAYACDTNDNAEDTHAYNAFYAYICMRC